MMTVEGFDDNGGDLYNTDGDDGVGGEGRGI